MDFRFLFSRSFYFLKFASVLWMKFENAAHTLINLWIHYLPLFKFINLKNCKRSLRSSDLAIWYVTLVLLDMLIYFMEENTFWSRPTVETEWILWSNFYVICELICLNNFLVAAFVIVVGLHLYRSLYSTSEASEVLQICLCPLLYERISRLHSHIL